MPIVGPVSAARTFRAEAVAGRAARRSPGPSIRPVRPGLPSVAETGPERPRVPVPILPEQCARPVSARFETSAKAACNIEPPLREGGWAEAITLLTIVAAVCLGVWMLF
ncbi:hypothetical protein MesoLjLc_78440 [Mesorhizobium sp. L-8-10]|uniref:hypothetical protein n=1 Tax=Mesorhizobium sp. L-8-10 TaxID=2744523 RepID=UPI001926B2B2|nr:hypothetical protein [Mesorhizobium sp. L-8-10]BCH35914.1 hypothetical protein MesoLjLc_78440 [Mesorhizobium sp. L-8-10]